MSEIARRLCSTTNGDGTAILDVDRNCIVTLNATGGFIWERLKQGKSVEVIVQELSKATDMNPHVVENDVRAFLRQLTEHGLFGE